MRETWRLHIAYLTALQASLEDPSADCARRTKQLYASNEAVNRER